jgi:hypothetical protein
MSRKFIPVEEAFREWRKDPKFVAAYDALEDEFAVASALIKARGAARALGESDFARRGRTIPSKRTRRPGAGAATAMDQKLSSVAVHAVPMQRGSR